MRISYFLNTDLLLRKASIHMIMKFCEALQNEGADACLVLPSASRMKVKFAMDFYGIKTPFRIANLHALNPFSKSRFSRMNGILFPLLALGRMVIEKTDIIYIRDQALLHLTCRIRKRAGWLFGRRIIAAEIHELYSDRTDMTKDVQKIREKEDFFLREADRVVVMTGEFKKVLIMRGVEERKILVAHDGVDLRMFRPLDKTRAREKLGLPPAKKIVVYSGHLDEWRGVYTLALAMKRLKGTLLLMVGGLDEDRERFSDFLEKERITNVRMAGHVDLGEVATYIASADVVVLPNSGKYPVSKYYVSPLKLFEYMACKRPIVASDLPNIGEILTHRKTAFLVTPDDPESFARGIRSIFSQPRLAAAISENAYKLAQKYTWYARARKVIAFLKTDLQE